MTDVAIQVKDLRKSFKDAEVLKGVNFEVKQGEICALLGSNGAGKTTIIKILSTLLSADDGIASVCGLDISRQLFLRDGRTDGSRRLCCIVF